MLTTSWKVFDVNQSLLIMQKLEGLPEIIELIKWDTDTHFINSNISKTK